MNDDISREDQLKRLLSNTSALLEAMRFSTATVSGEFASIGRYGTYKTFLRKYNDLAKKAARPTTMLDQIVVDNVRGSGDTTWTVRSGNLTAAEYLVGL